MELKILKVDETEEEKEERREEERGKLRNTLEKSSFLCN
jgi:hypothetical protein